MPPGAGTEIIYGPYVSYATMRQWADVTTLRERRVQMCDKFAKKCMGHKTFFAWFPLIPSNKTQRNSEMCLEEYARCDRLRNSPIFFMWRWLIGKPGKY